MTCHSNTFLALSQSSTKNTGCFGSFLVSLLPPFFSATSYALSLSIFRNSKLKTRVDVLEEVQESSVVNVTPCSGASGPTNPDQINNFIIRRAGEAKDARHNPVFPSLTGDSGVYCDCKRNGVASPAQPRADRYSF